MTIDVRYVDNGRGVIIRQSGVVTGKEIIAVHDEIYKQHKVVCQQYHIIDKSYCTEYNVTAKEIKIISSLDCKMASLNPDIIMAVIESNYLQFNLTDVWKVYIEDSIKYSKSFSDHLNALRWIKNNLRVMKKKQSGSNANIDFETVEAG